MDRTLNNPRQAALEALYDILEKKEKPKAVVNKLQNFDKRDTALINLTFRLFANKV